MTENLARSLNCVLMLFKLLISFSTKLLNLVFFFLKISKDRLCMNDLLEHSFCTSKAIYQNCLLPEQNQYIFLAGFLLAVKASSTTCFPFEE